MELRDGQDLNPGAFRTFNTRLIARATMSG
jgi:hypothetical protein